LVKLIRGRDDRPISVPLFFGLTVASIGGPLALIALYGPQAIGSATRSSALTALIASLFFLFPLAIWLRYSERIASSGGLMAFVEAAAGRRVARVQGALWVISYALYLVYTIPYIVYDLLPSAAPGTTHSATLIDGLLAVAIAALMLTPISVVLAIVLVMAAFQIVVALGFTAVNIMHAGLPLTAFTGHGNLPALATGAAQASLLYVCASLPLFLGGEVRGGGKTIRTAIGIAFAAIAILFVIAAIPLAHVGSPATASVVALGIAVSVGGLEIAEFIALSRLVAFAWRRSTTMIMRVLAAAFVAASLVALVNPRGVYAVLLKPSLVALWLSQLIVVAAYPWFARQERRLAAGDVGLAVAASALMVYGLYAAVSAPSPT
jgi:amino acid transporter